MNNINISPVIKTKGLGLKLGRRYLLRDVDWQVNKGEHWLVFGMNGCGKTTLLSIIAGFQKFTHGTLEVFGENYKKENILNFRKRIGWVSGSFFDKRYTSESVLDIVLSGKFGTLGVDFDISDDDVKKAKILLQEFNLKDKVNRPFDSLSKGERQNVMLTRAFISRPEILVLDEPGTGLDVLAREKMMDIVQNLAYETDMTMIYVTHYTEEIMPVFDKCLLMRRGYVYQQGLTENLFTQDNLSEFLGEKIALNIEQGHMRLKLLQHSNLNTVFCQESR